MTDSSINFDRRTALRKKTPTFYFGIVLEKSHKGNTENSHIPSPDCADGKIFLNSCAFVTTKKLTSG